MLVITEVFNDSQIKDRRKICFKQRQKEVKSLIRYTDYIDNKPFYIIEIGENYLNSERIQRLFSTYKGRILLNESLPQDPFQEYLFDAKDYYIKALMSSLLNKIKFEKNMKSLCIKCEKILICEEAFELVKFVRNVKLVVESEKQAQAFKNECFERYGTLVNIGLYNDFENFDISIDLLQMTPDGKCEIYFKGKRGLLYPDFSYFEVNDSVRKLMKYGVDRKIGCAICQVKKT